MKIPRYKPKLTQHMIILFAVIIAMLNLSANKLTAHADEYDKLAQVLADSQGTSGSGGTTATTNGVSYTRTGYLCYMLTTDGQTVPGTNAKAFKSPGYNGIANSNWMCKSRKGGYTASSWETVAPWGCTPWESGGSPTNEPKIRGWMTKVETGDAANAAVFVYDNWGEEVAKQFSDDKLVLVVETIMNFQWSTTESSSTSSTSTSSAQAQAKAIVDRYDNDMDTFMNLARQCGFGSSCDKFDDAYEKGYDNCLGLRKTRLDSYTNKVACFAEMIEHDIAGFKPWTGSTGSQISDAAVKNYGLAMGVYTAHGTSLTSLKNREIFNAVFLITNIPCLMFYPILWPCLLPGMLSLEEFAEKWMIEYAEEELEKSTVYEYGSRQKCFWKP